MIGIIQEQHPERTQLFMQWKEMDWPILVDSLNLLNVSAVPITALIDENGIVRKLRPQPGDLVRFLADSGPTVDFSPGWAAKQRPLGEAQPTSAEILESGVPDDPQLIGRAANASFLWGKDPGSPSLAIDLFRRQNLRQWR